ncbi:protein MAIN-LIKE 2-like [Gossypium raimondii]|uniref:protein MAIN-LIKE 2-like n=1 Tax=Gossypium raimondii TaxID=29730 RepID=UPI00227CA532|nr:protein MAIN-LIKE 2-like [Gossypium raimondii]
MAISLIRFDDKHISVSQAAMEDDRVLEGFIHNMGKPPIPQIRSYLQKAGFLHTSHMVRGCKLDPTLISALVERWRLETHTFHLLYGKCTITLEDVALQLSLPVDGPVLTGSVVVLSKVDLYKVMLGKVPNRFDSGRISINWLEDNFEKLL